MLFRSQHLGDFSVVGDALDRGGVPARLLQCRNELTRLALGRIDSAARMKTGPARSSRAASAWSKASGCPIPNPKSSQCPGRTRAAASSAEMRAGVLTDMRDCRDSSGTMLRGGGHGQSRRIIGFGASFRGQAERRKRPYCANNQRSGPGPALALEPINLPPLARSAKAMSPPRFPASNGPGPRSVNMRDRPLGLEDCLDRRDLAMIRVLYVEAAIPVSFDRAPVAAALGGGTDLPGLEPG